MHAQLFDLGDFPGAIPSDPGSGLLVGEVYRLPNPGHALKVIDEVEGFSPASPSTTLFRRALAEVTLENRNTVQAWIYWLNRWRGPRRRIASGDFARISEL